LHDIKDLYEQAHAENVTAGLPPSSLTSQCVVDHATVAPPGETQQIVVFVHGINNTEFDYHDSTETIFKRLYWSGYHGKVAGFRWPCAYLPFNNTLNPFDFNLGEFYAWKSAPALDVYLNYLRYRPDLAGYQIDLYAHSQGNIVASEAVRQGAPYDNYILTQGAVPAHCYDTSVPFLQTLLDAEVDNPTPFYATNGGYNGYFANLTGNLINFYNTNDYALAKGTWNGLQANWEADQADEKPENFAYRLGQDYTYNPYDFISTASYTFSEYDVTDPYEIMSMVARSRTRAIGAEDSAAGVLNTSASVDLRVSLGFGNTREEHSAQFTRPIQTALPYYQVIVNRIQPAQ
jgi:predicted esterase